MTPPSQPTPGPWQEITACQIYGPDAKLAPFTDSEGTHHPDYRTSLVALVYGDNGSATANARLIAAAPEMLVILRETLVALPNHTADCSMGPGPIRIQPSGAACCLFSETHANARALLAKIENGG